MSLCSGVLISFILYKHDQMSVVMRKPAICICKNKCTDQLRSNHAADQQDCFRNKDTSYIRNFKPITILCDCTALFVLDLVGNPKDRFSHDAAQIILTIPTPCLISPSATSSTFITKDTCSNNFRPQEYKTFVMLNSTEYDIYPTQKTKF